MKTIILSLTIVFIFIVNAHSQFLRYNSINLSTEATPSSGFILRKTNLHRLVEVKQKPPAVNSDLVKDVFPLPFTDNVNIEFTFSEKQNLSVKIFDVLGNLKKEFLIEKEKDNFYKNIKLNNLETGIYFLQVRLLNSNKSSQVKLVKMN